MRKRVEEAPAQAREEVVTVRIDTVTEQVVLAAAVAVWMTGDEKRLDRLLSLPADTFQDEKHASIWTALQELRRRKLDYDPATLQRLMGDRARVDYLAKLSALRPDVPTDLEEHLSALRWDKRRADVARGPLSALCEAVADSLEERGKVRALARSVAQGLEDDGPNPYICDPDLLVREMMTDVRSRAGRKRYTYGIPTLDDYHGDPKVPDGTRRLLLGTAPGHITAVTGLSGAGKSTNVGQLVVGIARQGRRVCYFPFEPGERPTLEQLTLQSLEWSRTEAREKGFQGEEADEMEEQARSILKLVSIARNPFRKWGTERKGYWQQNERNLDLVEGILRDVGAEVVVFDLWERMLVSGDDPGPEKDALFRTQSMMADLRMHGIVINQQGLKTVEGLGDPRPTRHGMKGTSAWVEVPDTIMGFFNPSKFRDIPDTTTECIILKQRYGKWPLAIEFDWDPNLGLISNGRSIPYTRPGSGEGSFSGGGKKSRRMKVRESL